MDLSPGICSYGSRMDLVPRTRAALSSVSVDQRFSVRRMRAHSHSHVSNARASGLWAAHDAD